jgi:glycogen operon protein
MAAVTRSAFSTTLRPQELACTSAGFGGDADLHVMMNMFWEPLDFEVPVDPKRDWHIEVDTFMPCPHDILDPDDQAPFRRSLCTVQGRSIVVLAGR